jgi:hypothetical protein
MERHSIEAGRDVTGASRDIMESAGWPVRLQDRVGMFTPVCPSQTRTVRDAGIQRPVGSFFAPALFDS